MATLRIAARLSLSIAVTTIVAHFAVDALTGLSSAVRFALDVAIVVPATTVLLWWMVLRGMNTQARRQELDGRLHRAFEMAPTESACHRVIKRALDAIVPAHGMQLLVADSSDAHLKRVLTTGVEGHAGCDVESPHDCPAIRRGSTLSFADSEALDACPHLATDRHGARSAVCSPVTIMGKTIAVLQVAGAVGAEPASEQVQSLESLATHAGSRLGVLRVLERTHLQAATDPLTGLLNRRTLEDRARTLLVGQRRFAVAMGDLDHFKKLNDVHGHDTGDRALRLFARTLQASVRSDDLVSRFGGEEFVVVFPDLSASQAQDVLHRVQEELLVNIGRAGVPSFSASFGVCDTSHASELDELLRVADSALFRAKREGRNRVVVDSSGVHVDPDEAFAEALEA